MTNTVGQTWGQREVLTTQSPGDQRLRRCDGPHLVKAQLRKVLLHHESAGTAQAGVTSAHTAPRDRLNKNTATVNAWHTHLLMRHSRYRLDRCLHLSVAPPASRRQAV
jgi:hypothetical protein